MHRPSLFELDLWLENQAASTVSFRLFALVTQALFRVRVGRSMRSMHSHRTGCSTGSSPASYARSEFCDKNFVARPADGIKCDSSGDMIRRFRGTELHMTLPTSNVRQARIPELDGLRGFAILMVVSIHYFYDSGGQLPPLWHRLQSFFGLGWTGVDLFFVLSGFLIGGILLDARTSPSYFKTFYLRRFFRIIPVYYLWIVLYLLLAWAAGGFFRSKMQLDAGPVKSWGIWAHFLFLQNLWIHSYAPLASWWFGASWSLAIEEQFYLVVPFVIWSLSKRRLIIFLVFVVFAALLCRILLRVFVPMSASAAYILMPCRADALALGVLGAISWRDAGFREWLSRNTKLLYGLFGALLAGMGVLGIWFSSHDGLFTQTVGYTWIALFYLSLLYVAMADSGGWIARLARMAWLREWGRVSYCVYLIHPAVRYFCFRYLKLDPTRLTGWRDVAGGLLAVAVTYGIARLSWTFFEQPLLRRGHRYRY
jgi:peptidoglycan/LPS O-acetylase OafA/YrhL